MEGSIKLPGGGQSLGAPTHSWLLPVGAQTGSHCENWRKSPSNFWKGEGKRNHAEKRQSILTFFTRSALRRDCLTRAWPAADLWEPNSPKGRETHNSTPDSLHMGTGGGKHLQPTPAILSHQRARKTEEHLRNSQFRGKGSLKEWDLLVGRIQCFPYHHHIALDLLIYSSFICLVNYNVII